MDNQDMHGIKHSTKHSIKFKAFFYGNEKMSAESLRNYWPISNKWELIECEDNPDLVVSHFSGVDRGSFWREVFKYRRLYGFKCFIIAITGEHRNFDINFVDYSISFQEDSKRNYYFPLLFAYKGADKLAIDWRHQQKHRPHFCNFIYSNGSGHFGGVAKRIHFCKLLSEYKVVDCAGPSLNNTDALKKLEDEIKKKKNSNLEKFEVIERDKWNSKVEFMSNYKFSIAFENQKVKGYITEKILHAYLAGTIPIYYGADDIEEYFNPESFINCNNYSNLSEVVERVKEIDNNPELFSQYINAPPVLDKSKYYDYSRDKISQKLDDILTKAAKHKQKMDGNKYPALYESFGWIRNWRLAFLTLLVVMKVKQRINATKQIIKQAIQYTSA